MKINTYKTGLASVLLALALVPNVAVAADLGGDCCADLEERVADLEKTTARKGNRKVSFKIYGQVNKSILFWDDGTNSDAYVVDNDQSSTRFGFKGKAKINSDWTAGYKIEINYEEDSSAKMSQTDDDDQNKIAIRKSFIYLKSKSFGTISWGQNSTASDGIAKNDLLGTNVIATPEVEKWVADFQFVDGTGANVRQIEKALPDVMGAGLDGTRGSVIRYDTPTLAGFHASAAYGENNYWDVALRFKETLGDFKVKAGIAYGERDADRGTSSTDAACKVDCEHLSGSVAVIHKPTGIGVTYATGKVDVAAGDETYQYIKAGIKQKFNGLGATSFYGEYYTSENINDDEVNMWGLGLVQKIDAAAAELYLGYRNYELDSLAGGTTDADDFMAVHGGMRIKF